MKENEKFYITDTEKNLFLSNISNFDAFQDPVVGLLYKHSLTTRADPI